MGRARKKIHKEAEDRTHREPTDVCRALRPTAERTVFLSAREMFSRKSCMLGHKTNLSKFKRTEIVQSMSSDHN